MLPLLGQGIFGNIKHLGLAGTEGILSWTEDHLASLDLVVPHRIFSRGHLFLPLLRECWPAVRSWPDVSQRLALFLSRAEEVHWGRTLPSDQLLLPPVWGDF